MARRAAPIRLLHHVSQDYRGNGAVTTALERMRTQEDIARILLEELFEALKGEG